MRDTRDVLLIRSNEGDLEHCLNEEGVPIAPMFARSSFASNRARCLRDVAPGLFASIDYPFNPRLKRAGADVLIVFDSSCTQGFLAWLVRHNPEKRIVLWYWNPPPARLDPKTIRRNPLLAGVELWSYSPRDCARHGLRRNTTFYVEQAFHGIAAKGDASNAEPEAMAVCAVFVGRDKGRIDALDRLKQLFAQAGCPLDLHIVADHPRRRLRSDRYRPPMAYRALLAREARARVIVDVYADPEAGLSLRAMEALRLGRKLVTNNRLIVQEPFYRPRNVLVLGEGSNQGELRAFLDRPLQPLPSKLVRSYEARAWLERFFDEGES